MFPHLNQPYPGKGWRSKTGKESNVEEPVRAEEGQRRKARVRPESVVWAKGGTQPALPLSGMWLSIFHTPSQSIFTSPAIPMLISLVPLGLVRFSKEDLSISCMDGKGLCARTLQAEYGKVF